MKEISKIQSQIKEALTKYETLKRVNVHIDEIDNQLKSAYQKIKQLDGQLDKELKDIDELDRIGVKSLFYKTLGSKEEQLEKERQEYLDLSLQYNEYKKEVELMEYERELLSKKLNSIGELEKQISSLKERRKKEILADSNNPLKNEFEELVHQLDVNIALQTEINEAIQEGEKSLEVLSKIFSFLRQAEDWGRWDMYGDNRRAKYAKQQSVQRALRLLPSGQHQLNIFMRELKDLGENNIVIKLDTVHFNKFRDFFFDNLISDWIIQQRIRSTLSNVESTHSHVKRILLSLVQEQNTINKKMNTLSERQDQIILS